MPAENHHVVDIQHKVPVESGHHRHRHREFREEQVRRSSLTFGPRTLLRSVTFLPAHRAYVHRNSVSVKHLGKWILASIFAQCVIEDSARYVFNRHHSRNHLIALPFVLIVASVISSHNGVHKVPLLWEIPEENQGLNQKGLIRQWTIALPATNPRRILRGGRRELPKNGNPVQQEVHMVPYMMPLLTIPQREVKEILKTVVLLQAGDLYRLADRKPPRCQSHIHGNAATRQRSRKLSRKTCRSSQRYVRRS